MRVFIGVILFGEIGFVCGWLKIGGSVFVLFVFVIFICFVVRFIRIFRVGFSFEF